jgi:four helix bundle protein
VNGGPEVANTAAAKVADYKDLIVWKKAMALTKRVYELTARFPAEEKFGLTSQMRRAAVSVPSNIAEGQGRRGPGEFPQFLAMARGWVTQSLWK